MTTTTAHTFKITGRGGRAGKLRRVECSCGWLGCRFNYTPGPGSFAKAQALAEADGANHLARIAEGKAW